MRLPTTAVAALLVLLAVPALGAVPGWFQHHMEYMAAEGGRWITSNAPWVSDDEPFDAYGMEWSFSRTGTSLVGRLYGFRDGEEVATFWTFQEFWHPGENRAVVTQIGLGAQVGTGVIDSVGVNETRAVQTFYYMEGVTEQIGHLAVETDSLVTTSFSIDEDGTWTERRRYVWHRDR